jgi:hypothetical protein
MFSPRLGGLKAYYLDRKAALTGSVVDPLLQTKYDACQKRKTRRVIV